jgi:hypothetical protein
VLAISAFLWFYEINRIEWNVVVYTNYKTNGMTIKILGDCVGRAFRITWGVREPSGVRAEHHDRLTAEAALKL